MEREKALQIFKIVFAVHNEATYKIISQEFLKIPGVVNEKRVSRKEELIETITEKKNDIDAIFITTDLPGEESLIKITRDIPKEVRVFALDTVNANDLIIGKMKKNGAEFIEEVDDIEKIVLKKLNNQESKAEPEAKEAEIEDEDDPEDKTEKTVKVKKEKKIDKPFKSSKIKSVDNVRTDNVRTDNNIRTVETIKHNIVKTKHIEYVTPPDYKRILAFFSPFSTGKTEISTNVAVAAAMQGKKVALLDLDLEKYGAAFNFQIKSPEDYFKYRVLYQKLKEYIKGQRGELSLETISSLATYKQKNLWVYTGNHEIKIDDFAYIEHAYRFLKDGLIEDDDLIKNQRQIIIDTLTYLIRRIKELADIIIIDVGSKSSLINETILNFDNLEKFLVTDQNIEILNAIAFKMKLKNELNYKNWNLIVNKCSIKSLNSPLDYFFDKSVEIDYLKYNIKKIYNIPYVNNIWDLKCKRKTVYNNNNKSFDREIENILASIFIINSENKGSILNKIFLSNFSSKH